VEKEAAVAPARKRRREGERGGESYGVFDFFRFDGQREGHSFLVMKLR